MIDMAQANDRRDEDWKENHQSAQDDDGHESIADPQHQDGRDSDRGQRLGRPEERLDGSG